MQATVEVAGAPWRPWAWKACAPLAVALTGAFAALVVLAPTLSALKAHAGVALEDDGFYYAQIARTLARTGRSSFDGLSDTNGYHPLWLLVLTLKTRVAGDSPLGVVLIEAGCIGGAVAVLIRGSGVRAWGPALIFAAAFAHYVGAMAGAGMEVSLFALCAAAFVGALNPRAPGGPLWLGAAAAACVGARIDSAVFVGPALLLCARSRRERGMALGVLAAAGTVYVGVNLAVFGAAMPVSSAVKSLGGLQLNHRFLAQLAGELRVAGRGGGGRMVMALAGCALSPLVALAAPRGSTGRALGLATGIGGALLFTKLAFDSSWQIWPWYAFPFVFVFATALFALAPHADAMGSGARTALGLAGALAVALVAARAARTAMSRPASPGFYAVNQAGAARFAALTGGAPLAMGDRAGSFAWSYPGPVVQLEGLVNDAAWLRLLRRREAPTPELCRRGVRYLAAYTPAGPYTRLTVPLMRPRLTQYPAPSLDVNRADELAAVALPAAFAGGAYGDGDPVLRLWRLHCPAPAAASAVAPAPPRAGP